MPALPILFIPAVVEKILLALGVAAAGAVLTDDALRKRKKEAEEAKDARVTPIARAETRSEAKPRKDAVARQTRGRLWLLNTACRPPRAITKPVSPVF